MKRRDLLKFGLVAAVAAMGGTGFLSIYKRISGVSDICEHPVRLLRKIAAPVDGVDDNIIALSRRMIATLRYYSLIGFFSKAFMGRGLAAPQVGVSQRVIVCGIYGELHVLINPQIVAAHGTYAGYESCLSVPHHDRKMVIRPGFLKVRYRGIDDRAHELAVANSYAALLAHEIDHLNGTLYIDYS